jgi:hypothetical protein
VFDVVAKDRDGNQIVRRVYSVRVDENTGETEFLIWFMNKWLWQSSHLYSPLV